MSSPILQVPVDGCDNCGNPRLLYGVTVLGLLCSDCYTRKGQPMGAALGPIHEMEERTRERMMARGSAHKHLVMKGLT